MALFFNEFLQKQGEVWVTIPDSREIPLMGKGPFLKPERISEENYKILINLGYKVEKLPATDLLRVPLITRPLKNPLNQGLIQIDNKNKVIDNNEKEKVEVIHEIKETIENTPEIQETVENTVVEEVASVEEPKVEEQPKSVRVKVVKPAAAKVEKETEDDISKLTKAELKAILDEAGVQYKYETKLSELQELVRGIEK